MTDHVKNHLCQRIEELEKEKLELNEQLDIVQQERDALAAPAVQGEPVGWQFYQDGKWWHGDDRIKDHRKNTEEAGFRVRDVYAAPQPAPSAPTPTFRLGDHVRKTKGSQRKGRVVGTYSTSLTPEGYAVESDTEEGGRADLSGGGVGVGGGAAMTTNKPEVRP